MKSIIRLFGFLVISGIKAVYYRVYALIVLLAKPSCYLAESYYPEFKDKRKSPLRIFFEQLVNIMRYGFIDDYYFAYGFDIKGLHKKSDYVEYSVFRKRRNRLNNASLSSPLSVLRNKLVFAAVAKSYGLNTPEPICLIQSGKVLIPWTGEQLDLQNFLTGRQINAYCKLLDGECGQGVFKLTADANDIKLNDAPIDFAQLLHTLGKGRFLLQEAITNQCLELSTIYPHSINTIRLETIVNPKTGSIEIFPPLLRVGAHGNIVDNWAKGGLAITIDVENHCLGELGYYKIGKGTKTDRHPDTGVIFQSYKLPFINEAIEQAKRFHQCLPGIHSIGWDIALTEQGPCFIEGNDNWEISLVQMCSHGLKQDFDQWFAKG